MSNGILCLESSWSNDSGSTRTSVSPLIEFIGRMNGVKQTTFTCGTPEELSLRLKKCRRGGYGILYLAGHGEKGEFATETEYVTLSQIAEMMNHRFEGFAVHFGSCAVMQADYDEVLKFKRSTKVRKVSGYKEYVDWSESSAFEVIWLSRLIDGYRLDNKLHSKLIRHLGFSVV